MFQSRVKIWFQSKVNFLKWFQSRVKFWFQSCVVFFFKKKRFQSRVLLQNYGSNSGSFCFKFFVPQTGQSWKVWFQNSIWLAYQMCIHFKTLVGLQKDSSIHELSFLSWKKLKELLFSQKPLRRFFSSFFNKWKFWSRVLFAFHFYWLQKYNKRFEVC